MNWKTLTMGYTQAVDMQAAITTAGKSIVGSGFDSCVGIAPAARGKTNATAPSTPVANRSPRAPQRPVPRPPTASNQVRNVRAAGASTDSIARGSSTSAKTPNAMILLASACGRDKTAAAAIHSGSSA